MARVWALALCCMVCITIETTVASQFTVGGSNGWAVPSGSDKDTYNQWAGRNRFQIGDTLLFKYDKREDSVLQVSQASYNTCNTSGPIASYTDGNTVFKFSIHGPFYFISGNQSRCQLGEKLIVAILSPCHFGQGENCKRTTSPVSAPSPTLSPAHVPSPSPTITAPATSPTNVPSPSPIATARSPTMASPSSSPSPSMPSPALSPSPGASSPSPSPIIASVPSPSPAPIVTAPASSPTNAPSPSPTVPASSPTNAPSPSPTVPAISPTMASPSPSPSPSMPSPALSPSPSASSPSSPPIIASVPPVPTPASTSPPPPPAALSSLVSPSASTPPPPSPSSVTSSAFPSLLNLLIPLLFAAVLNAKIATI